MTPPTPGRRAGVLLAVAIAAHAPGGCAPERRQITPTTSGTNLRTMPRGRMIPQPFPGSSLARAGAHPANPAEGAGPTADPEATAAAAEAPSPRR